MSGERVLQQSHDHMSLKRVHPSTGASFLRIDGHIWGFPKIGVPLNHPFVDGFSLINHPAVGAPLFWKPPYLVQIPFISDTKIWVKPEEVVQQPQLFTAFNLTRHHVRPGKSGQRVFRGENRHFVLWMGRWSKTTWCINVCYICIYSSIYVYLFIYLFQFLIYIYI